MKKKLIVMCLIGLVASSAWAYPGPNSMGVYMDAEATGPMAVCDLDVGLFETLNLYMLISGPTQTQCAAWEAEVIIETTVNYFGNWEVLGNGLNVGSGNTYLVGLGDNPIQPNTVGNLVLMHLPLTVADVSAPIQIFIRRAPGSLSFPDGPGYAHTVGIDTPCVTSTGGPLVPVFEVNGICGTSNEMSTWGGVKSLY